MNKTILLVGAVSSNPAQYTYAPSFARALQKLGNTVVLFNNKKKLLPFSINRLTRLNNYLINKQLLSTVKKLKPQIIFLLKADNIFSSTLRAIKKTDPTVRLINFYPDNPFVFWNGNSNTNVLESLPYYDDFLIWSSMLVPVLESAGCKRVHYFPLGFDGDLFAIDSIAIPSDRYQTDVCFVGTWEPERERWLSDVCQRLPNQAVAIWGDLWSAHIRPGHILYEKIRGNAIYGTDMIRIFQQSKIVLNFIRQQNASAHNMRTFEVPACKAFLLTQRTKEQAQELFQEGYSIECFESIDELIVKIEKFIDDKNEHVKRSIIDRGYNVVQQFSLTRLLKNFFAERETTYFTQPKNRGGFHDKPFISI